ncbi:MAG: DUF2799 domain-containing protein [Pseudomonadota bacterium]|nr:DUF2799 domain-containing protein [Pseudomonadota bacterium]
MLKARALTAVLIATVCAGCATLDESACRAGNWRQLGYVDGLKGYAGPRIAEHQKACAEYGIAPDTTAWQLGYVEGQAQYCTAPIGYIQGRDDRSYADVCPPKLDAKFRPAFENGKRVAAILNHMDDIDNALRDITLRLEADDRRAAEYLDAVRGGHKPSKRPELISRGDRRDLERDFSNLNADYAAARRELERRDADYSAEYDVAPLEPVQRD